MFTASEIFDLAIQVEINGERFYRYALSKVEGVALKKVLGWLADQELQHKSAFKAIQEKITRSTAAPPPIASLSRQAVRAAMGRHAFSLDELQIGSINTEKEILLAAVLFEEDAILFFEFIASFVSDPDALSTLEEIRKEELHHKLLLIEKMSEM